MQQADFVALVQAAQSLESMSLAARRSQLVGMPIEKALDGALFSLNSALRNLRIMPTLLP